MQRTFFLSLAALLAGFSSGPALAAGKVNLESLLPQMTDLRLLAEYPDPPYVVKQFSSYDRDSKAPGSESWFANADRGFMLYDGVLVNETAYFATSPTQGKPADGQFAAGTRVGISPTHRRIGGYVWVYATAADGRPLGGKGQQGYIPQSALKMDPQGHVLAEMDGPGAVVRIWSANPKDAGRVRIYLDGAEKPVIEASLEELLGGKWTTVIDGKQTTPFPDPIACERSRGFNLYFPIAYARHCKITIDRPDIYYHVDYRTYPSGTDVETFTWAELDRMSPQVQQTIVGLRLPIDQHLTLANLQKHSPKLEPGKSFQMTLDGPQAIVALSAKLAKADEDPNSQAAMDAWRSLILTATFDGAAQPQISCPLGDFFGSAPGLQAYASLPFDVVRPANEMRAWWCMPFEKSAVVEVRNLGKRPYQLDLAVASAPHAWSDRSMHFHAKWRAESLKSRPFRDWTYCDLKGKGVFVGDMLSLTNPVSAWWGEGDEKIYVDDERFPSWFGTGSEDYYGYAWSDPKPFQHAYHSQTRCDGPGNRGRTSVNRFHVLDAIPFTTSFRFDIEFWHWTPNIDVPYAATSYWYARPGATDDFKELKSVVLPTVPPPPSAYRIKGALEGEQLKIVGKSSEFELGPQDMGPFGDGQWSGASQLWGRPTKAGEWVDLELPARSGGLYQVRANLTKARDYGIVQLYLDGRPLGRPIDCFHADNVVCTGLLDLGTVKLENRPAKLRVEAIAANPKSTDPRYLWGLDCIVLKPVGGAHGGK